VTPLTVRAPGVLGNDVDTEDGDPLVASLVRRPSGGSATLNPDGSFTYTPDTETTGTDTFTYQASDGIDLSPPATVSIAVGAPPQGVQAVAGGACAYLTDVSLFGGPQDRRGCGQTVANTASSSPSVTLPPTGSGPIDAAKPEGAIALYGPAAIFSGIWPDDATAAPASGPLSVRTAGATGPGGSVTSSAHATLREVPRPVRCNGDPAGTTNCSAPGGIGPGPLIANEAHSTCTANEAGLSGTATFVNGILETKYDSSSQVAILTENVPANPPPNYTRDGTLDHVGDSFRVVFNEQILGPDSITVNAAHMYLLGPTAVGDMVIGQSRCAVVTSAANTAPVGTDDAYTATAGRPLVVPAAGVLANDTDAEGQPLSAAKLPGTRPPASGGGEWNFPGQPAHGTLDLRPDGSFTYTPAPGYTGPDSFTYLAQDSRGKSDAATVTLTVEASARLGVADFDADGDTDRAVFRAGAWYAEGQTTAYFGQAGDVAVPGDYDGDGDLDRAVYRGGAWYVEGQATLWYGNPDDVPVPGDYDGDGDTDRAVFRPSVGAWFIDGQTTVYLGAAGDIAVPGDYDADGDTDAAVWRPSTGAWHVDGQPTQWLGLDGDVPVPGDYDGNGTTERAVWRPASGAWHVAGQPTQWLGLQGDVPVPGDYDANATNDRAVWRPPSGAWHVDGKPTVYLGATGDQALPLPAAIRKAMP
jgi:hypothetical protein